MASPVQRRKLPLNEYAAELRQWLHMSKQCQMANSSYQALMLSMACQPPPAPRQPAPAVNRSDNTSHNAPPRQFPENAGL